MADEKKQGKIYFYVYPSAFQNPGGGEVLLLKTKEYAQKEGQRIFLFNQWEDRFQKGDLLHVFGSVKEALGLMISAKSLGALIIHSPIIWYNWQSSIQIPYPLKDRLLCVARQAAKTLFPMIPSERKTMMKISDYVTASSEAEAGQIARYFLIPKDRIHVIPYGADIRFRKANGDLFVKKFGIKDFILTTGRIEPRKNQLNLIRAMKRVRRPLVIIGSPVSYYQDYYRQCRAEGEGRVHFLGPLAMDSEELKSAYGACAAFALPTWFETPGIAALEAALAGAPVIITREGSTREYFKDFAAYVNPASISDISDKINRTLLNREKSGDLQQHIDQNYTWQVTARKTLALYQFAADHS